jgi:hypothetical protein
MISKRVMLVGAVVVGVSYFLAIQRVSPSEPETHIAGQGEPSTSVNAAQELPHAAQTDVRVDREIQRLNQSLVKLEGELAAMHGAKQATSPQPEAVVTPKTPEQEQAEHDEYMAVIERAFEQEPRNESWAIKTTQRLRKTLETEPIILAAVRGIECRSSSCRMEIRDDGSATFGEEFPIMVHEMGAVLPEVRFTHSDLGSGTQLHVLYMSKSAAE